MHDGIDVLARPHGITHSLRELSIKAHSISQHLRSGKKFSGKLRGSIIIVISAASVCEAGESCLYQGQLSSMSNYFYKIF